MDSALLFERTMQLFFSDGAYQIAGLVTDVKERKKWLRKLIRKITKIIDALDTSSHHKKLLFAALDQIAVIMKEKDEQKWEGALVCELLKFIGLLLGFCHIGQRAYIIRSPVYCQNENQFITEQMRKDSSYSVQEEEHNIIVRQSLIAGQLKDEGLTDFKISMILNISEKKVKELRKQGKKFSAILT